MSKWMYSSISRNNQDMGDPDIESVGLKCKKLRRKSDKTRFEIFLYLFQVKSILSILMEITSSQHKINPGGALKQGESFCRTIAEACKTFICWCLSVFKNELLERIKIYFLWNITFTYILYSICFKPIYITFHFA